jgi:hypothetical protein
VIESHPQTIEEAVDVLRLERRKAWVQHQQSALPIDVPGPTSEVSAQSFFSEFIERLRATRVSAEAAPKGQELIESVKTISRVVGVRIPCDEHSEPSDGLLTAGTAQATKHALLSLCLPDASRKKSERELSLLVRKYIDSNDLSLFTAEGILNEAKQFFTSTGERAISFEEVVKVLLVATLVRLRAQSLHSWDQVVQAVTTRFPDVIIEHLLSFQGSYLSKQDLIDLDIPPEKHKAIHDRVSRGQLFGTIESRHAAIIDALSAAGCGSANRENSQADVLGSSDTVKELLTRSGSDPATFVSRDTEDVFRPQPTSKATYTLFRCISREQFPPRIVDQEVRFELLHSGNYPAIARELGFAKLSVEDVVARMRAGAIRNLPELEEFSKLLSWRRQNLPHASSVSLNQLEWITSSKAVFAEVRVPGKDGTERSITLGLGYQGANHEGTGVAHVIKQRAKDSAFRKFIKVGEDIDTAVERFIRDGVLYCAGEGTLRIPSRLSPNTHTILLSNIHGTDDQFISLVLGKASREGDPQDTTIDASYLVTALFHKNAATLRQSLKKELSGWAENQHAHRSFEPAILVEYLQHVNEFLGQFSIAPITLSEIMPGFLPEEDSMPILSAASDDDSESLFGESFDDSDEIHRLTFEDASPRMMAEDYAFEDDDFEEDGTVEVPGLSFIPLGS